MQRTKAKRKVLLIGWDAADWKVIRPLMAVGRMPHLQRLIETGASGNICTLHPVLSPMLWTSIATGKRPFKHGIYGFYEPTPDRQTIQPTTSLQRKTKTVWNILNQNKLRSSVVGWWPSNPVEKINGAMVSDLFFKSSTKSGYKQAPPPESVHPEELTELLTSLRYDISEVTADEIRAFIPEAERVDQDNDQRMAVCAKILCECTSVQNIATQLLESQDWDFMGVYFDAIDHFSHAFMKYHPPRRDFIPQEDFDLYHNVVTMGYCYHDLMLGRLLELSGDDVTTIVMSDHGFHPDHLRPKYVPSEPAGPAVEHRDLGIFVINGPGIKKGEQLHGLSLLDVAPTVLSLYGLPVGKDMDGRVIATAFESPMRVRTIESWDDVEGDDACHDPEKVLTPEQSQQAIQQLVDLGYMEAPSDDDDENVRRAEVELEFNLARSYLDANRHQDALPLLRELYAQNPSEYRIGAQLALCYRQLGLVDELHALVEMIKVRRISEAQVAKKKVQRYLEIVAKRKLESKPAKEDNEESAQDQEQTSSLAEEYLTSEESVEFRTLKGRAKLNLYALEFLGAYAMIARGQYKEGVESLKRAIDDDPSKPGLYTLIAEAYQQLEMYDEAIEALQTILKIDENSPQGHQGLASVYLAQGRNESALAHAQSSVKSMFFNPRAHFVLGQALVNLGNETEAIETLRVAVQQNQNFEEAHTALASLYESQANTWLAAEHTEWAAASRTVSSEQRLSKEEAAVPEIPDFEEDDPIIPDRITEENDSTDVLPTLGSGVWWNRASPVKHPDDYITIVTGLPRSGTSMMMQMLQAAGVEPHTDGNREADESNPRGYLEYDRTKSLATDNAWVVDAQNKSLKVVVQMIQHLPAKLNYRFFFMLRDLDEVVESQYRMLERNGAHGADMSPEKLKGIFTKHLEEAQRIIHESGMPAVLLDYARVVQNPLQAARSVSMLLNRETDLSRMAESVDKGLYRTRVQAIGNQAASG
ncbi:MAG: alkaline phosphatase family protein [Planctomycetota bacterium]